MIAADRVTPAIALVSSIALLSSAAAWAAPPKPAPASHAAPRPAPAPPAPPPPPLAMLPSIARVKIEVLKTQLLVTQEINLPRGEWKGEPLDFYAAFGAPGAPRAIDAHLLAVADGALEPEDDDVGEALLVDRAAHRPVSAHALIGRDTMAGVVIHAKRESLVKAFGPGNMAALRIRTALDLPEEDAGGARGVVVRLGASRGTPLTLGRLTLLSRPGAGTPLRAEARLCGPDAATPPLAIALVPRLVAPVAPPAPTTPAIAPVLAVRHASDDLCIRFWTSP